MGLYQDHGVEYRAVLKNGKVLAIVPSRNADERLSQSSFYKKREAEWVKFQPILSSATPITDDDFDVKLSPEEEEHLAKVLNVHDVQSHGWYDVVSTGDSYG